MPPWAARRAWRTQQSRRRLPGSGSPPRFKRSPPLPGPYSLPTTDHSASHLLLRVSLHSAHGSPPAPHPSQESLLREVEVLRRSSSPCRSKALSLTLLVLIRSFLCMVNVPDKRPLACRERERFSNCDSLPI